MRCGKNTIKHWNMNGILIHKRRAVEVLVFSSWLVQYDLAYDVMSIPECVQIPGWCVCLTDGDHSICQYPSSVNCLAPHVSLWFPILFGLYKMHRKIISAQYTRILQ